MKISIVNTWKLSDTERTTPSIATLQTVPIMHKIRFSRKNNSGKLGNNFFLFSYEPWKFKLVTIQSTLMVIN